MGKRVSFQLTNVPDTFKLNGGLKDVVRFSEKRSLSVGEMNRFHSDFDGDGQQDHFVLNILPGNTKVECYPRKSQCTLFLPHGKDGVTRMMPGYANGNTPADIYIETKEDGKLLLQHQIVKDVLPKRSEADYEKHLKKVGALREKNWDAAVSEAIRYNLGLTHSWVVPEDKISSDPLTWIHAEEPYTNCTFEFERVLAELRSDGSVGNFKDVFRNVQYYDSNGGPERADFTTAEALPHYRKLGIASDETERLFHYLTQQDAPRFKATINKEAWYRGLHNGEASGKNFPQQQLDLSYIPFATAVTLDATGQMRINPNLAEILPDVSVAIVMNKDKHFDKLGTDIPESHVFFLVKDGKGIKALHSTPTTDLGIAAVTSEDFDTFMKARYAQAENGVVVNNGKDKTVVGFKILFINQVQEEVEKK